MEKTFAVVEDSLVVNLIVAESLEIAEQVTGLECVEYYAPKIGDSYINGEFVPVDLDD